MSGFPRLIGTAFCLVFLACGTRVERQQSEPTPAPSIQESPSVRLRAATLVKFPAKVDCNSPAHWDGDRLYLFNSAPEPWRSSGNSVFDLGQAVLTRYQNKANGGRWIEATYKDDDGTLYGWYHNEPHPVCPAREAFTAPRIGAALSHDNGGARGRISVLFLRRLRTRCSAKPRITTLPVAM